MYKYKKHLTLSSVVIGFLLLLTLLSFRTSHSQSEEQKETTQTVVFLPFISSQQNRTQQTDVPEGYMIIEGDIQVREDFFEAQASATFTNEMWSNRRVPYQFDNNVSADNQNAARAAMDEWEQVSNVQFVQCANNSCTGNFVHIQDSLSNNSAVGMQGGRQTINIVSWDSEFIIAHELGHTLGLWHEQSRGNRDNYIQINLGNVCKATDSSCGGGFCFNNNNERVDCDDNFNKQPGSFEYGPYDFDSLMHYEQDAFSRNGQSTITVLAPYGDTWQNLIGQRDHLSTMDKRIMSFLYPEVNWELVTNSSSFPLQNGSFFFPWNSLSDAVSEVASGGTIWLKHPGEYAAVGTYDKPMTIQVAYGEAVLK